MVSHFSFQGGSELVETMRVKVLGGAGIRDLNNGDVVDFFPNGEVIHVPILCLLDCYCVSFLLEANSVGK